MTTEKIILPESSEAATFRTGLSGWVDRSGFFWGTDEHQARWSGATHIHCDQCGEIILKRSYCHTCHAKKERKRYEAMPKEPWNGEDLIYSFELDKYYSDIDSIDADAEENGISIAGMMLVFCDPVYASRIDIDGLFDDDLPDGARLYDVDRKLATMLRAVNLYIKKRPPILSYFPGKVAVDVSNL